jgi:amino acid adenylation domain-containing protein
MRVSAARARIRWGPNVDELNARLKNLSPEKRALLMQQLARQTPVAPRNDLTVRARPARIPLSYAQQRLWILDQLDPGSSAYNVPTSMWLRGRVDQSLLERALTEIVRRHESLRTVIAADGEGPHQRVGQPFPVTIATRDVSDVAEAQRSEAAFDLAREEARRSFDIARGPLLRAVLIRLDAEHHLFVLNAHHIAVDGWSLSILYDELAKLYAAFHAGGESPLPPLAVQYVDYTLWQRELLAGDTLRTQLGYWQERLSGRVPLLEIPADRARPPVQSNRGAVMRHSLDAGLNDALKRLSRQEGATTFMTLLAAFDTLLWRWTGQTDVVVGVGVANRRRQELEPLVGFFVNTLALRADLSGNPSFRELIARVKDITLGAYSHQDLPIERLLEELNLERALSHSPLFQVMLFFQSFPSEEIELPGLTLAPVDFDAVNPGTSRADLALFAVEDAGKMTLFFEYATDLFDPETIATLARSFEQLLRDGVGDPTKRIGDLAIVPDDERDLILRRWNATQRALPGETTVHALIEAQVYRTPDAVAIEQGERRLTYGELDQRANALAQMLVARGAAPGSLVGIYVERTPDMLVAQLGVLKAGAAYVPLDPAYPTERIGFMLEDADLRFVVTQRAIAAQLPSSRAELVLVDDLVPRAARAVGAIEAEEHDLAYVIFTSGSTGRPKGVQLPHRAVVNFLASMAREPGMTADDVVCAVTTLSFDIAVLELLLPLTVGARVVLADRATASDGAALARLIASSHTTVMQATPATWRMLRETGWTGGKSLRILCGGEALPRELADSLLPCCAELWNLYGPTETTVWSAIERVQAGDAAITVGKPIANTAIYLVDARLQPVPVGVPGELLIGGAGVARDYLNRAELTAEKFIPDPFSATRGARCYRTGDLARWRRDGRIEMLGRMDNQVKLRGFRIELGEIESVLAEHEAVRQAVVTCREDRPGDKRLVAYIVANAGASPSAAELRAHVRTRLPDYMTPSACMVLDTLPLTPNGKVDRRALPAPDADAIEAEAYTAPRNDEETTLAALWAEVLGIARVGIHDDFFALGGHSLLATQLISRVQKQFGGDVALRAIFEAPTVAGFAQLLMQQRVDAIDSDALAGMLDQLEGLSDADIQALLAHEGEPS